MRNSNSYLDTINKSRPVIFNYKNRNKNGISFLYGLITQEGTQIIPYNMNLSYGISANKNTEVSNDDIKEKTMI